MLLYPGFLEFVSEPTASSQSLKINEMDARPSDGGRQARVSQHDQFQFAL
jgi:hypothetical protein